MKVAVTSRSFSNNYFLRSYLKKYYKDCVFNESNKIINGFIVRSLDAYPVIKKGYQEEVEKIKSYISRFKNLHPIGRSGMFKYNNQDHAIATGIYAARNLTEVNHNIDIWNINSEGVYLEGEAK